MKESRRDFIQASLAISVITVSRTQATAAPKQKIALVVSSTKKDDHEAAFFQALSDFRWYPDHPNDQHANFDYSQINLDTKKVDKFDLIVTAGGIPAAAGVATALKQDGSSTPFIFLIGRYPQSASGSIESPQTADPEHERPRPAG